MLSLVSKQKTTDIVVYLDTNNITVKQSIQALASAVVSDKITVKLGIPPIHVYDNTFIYVEPFVYVDGGLYDSEGTPVDAEYYNTALWAVTYNGGYA